MAKSSSLLSVFLRLQTISLKVLNRETSQLMPPEISQKWFHAVLYCFFNMCINIVETFSVSDKFFSWGQISSFDKRSLRISFSSSSVSPSFPCSWLLQQNISVKIDNVFSFLPAVCCILSPNKGCYLIDPNRSWKVSDSASSSWL